VAGVDGNGNVTGLARGSASIEVQDAECDKARDSRGVRVIDKEEFDRAPLRGRTGSPGAHRPALEHPAEALADMGLFEFPE
jgi:hypothetical protein